MTDATFSAAVDPGLLSRFRIAGAKVAWRAADTKRKGPPGSRTRVAHLHDEEARVEESGRGRRFRLVVEPGPLGALLLLLEIDRRGRPSGLGAAEAGNAPGFPSGAIVAVWGGGTVPSDSVPTVGDLVELARYALA